MSSKTSTILNLNTYKVFIFFFLQIAYSENKSVLTLSVQGEAIILGGTNIRDLLKWRYYSTAKNF